MTRPAPMLVTFLGMLGCAPADSPSEGAVPSDGLVDADGDGLWEDFDCDDTDPSLGGPEVPYDGVDNDCNPLTLDDDADGDGVPLADDCDDGDGRGWLPSEPWEGDVVGFDEPCEGYCARPVLGSIVLSRSGKYGLEDLRCVTTVTGDIDLMSGSFESLDDLERLQSIGGGVYLRDVESLRSIEALGGVTVGGDIVIEGSALVDLAGLEHLEHVGGDLLLRGNAELSDLGALAQVENIDGVLTLDALAIEHLSGLGSLVRTGGLEVHANLALVDFEGLDALTWVDGDLVLSHDPLVEDLTSLPPVDVAGTLVIERLNALTDLQGLLNLDEVGGLEILTGRSLETLSGVGSLDGAILPIHGDVVIEGNQALVDLAPIGTTIDGTLRVADNLSLTTLAGFESVEEIGGALEIEDNDALVELGALHGVTSVGADLVIEANPELPQHEVDALIAAIDEVGGEISTADNGP